VADSALVDRFQAAQEKVTTTEQERNLVDAREQTFLENLAAYKAKLKEEGVDPAKIDDEISKIEGDIDQHLTGLEGKLSGTEAPQETANPA
jgi:hypothetical protein